MARRNVMERFTDVTKEPHKTLSPIEGYEKVPLVSLKEAVDEIKSPIHNLERMIWIAERDSKHSSDGLTSDESAAIRLYTMQSPNEEHESFYTVFNRRLRDEKRHELKSWYLYMKLFFTALYKLTSLKAVVWRGINGDVSQDYQNNDTKIWWGVSSCTETMEVLETFIGRQGIRTIFMIECINGKAIESYSSYRDEKEIILMPGTFLRVVSKWSPAEGLHMIQLREETPRFQLLASPFGSSPSSSSMNTVPSNNRTTILKPYQESNVTTASILPRPKYKNAKLEQKINENKDKTELWLHSLNLNDNDMELVAYYLFQTNVTLTTLYLHENQIGDKGAQYLGEKLQTNTKLTELYLHKNRIGDNGAQHLALGLSYNTTLTELSLSENQIGIQGAQYLGEGLKQNRTLTKLDLSNNQIGAEGTQYLSEGLRKNKTLIILDLSKNHIGAQGARYLAESLQINKTITTLFLDDNQIEDRGVQYLSEGLQQNRALIKLDLYNNQIGTNGAQYLERLKRNNRHLNLSW